MARLDAANLKSNVGNAQKSFMWEVVIPNPIGGGDVDALHFRARTAVLPGESIGVIHIDHGNSAGVEYTGRRRLPHALEMTYMEGEDLLVYRSIRAWMSTIHGNGGAGASGDMDAKTDMYMYLIGANDADTLKLRIMGAWIQNRADVTLNFEDGVLTFTITVQYDDVQEA